MPERKGFSEVLHPSRVRIANPLSRMRNVLSPEILMAHDPEHGMKEYVLIFRMDISPASQPGPELMKVRMDAWMEWINGIAAKNQLAAGGNHLSVTNARLIRSPAVITEGPYTINHESVAGYILIRARGIANATAIARDCPILQGEGTSVEIRETELPGEMKDVRRK